MARKLYYSDLRGYGEGLRYLLHYGGLEFEDVRIPREKFYQLKSTLNLPFGKIPVYMEGDKVLHQSQVIAKYIGRQVGLVPSDPWEEAQLDTVPHTVADFFGEVRNYIQEKDPEKKEQLKKKILDETFDFYFSRFEKMLVENNGHFGKQLSWVDITFVGNLIAAQDFTGITLGDKYPKIKQLIAEVQGLRGIKEYIEKTYK